MRRKIFLFLEMVALEVMSWMKASKYFKSTMKESSRIKGGQ
jgi:hypothetical protein